MTSPRTCNHAGVTVVSDFGGGDDNTAFSTTGICSVLLWVPESTEAESRSERIE